jgi:methanogenic corrinoid protein MtbC1
MVGLRQQVIEWDCWPCSGEGHSNRSTGEERLDLRLLLESWGHVTAAEGIVQRSDLLTRTIEGEIIPRLMLAHRLLPMESLPARVERPAPTAEEVVELARLVLSHDTAVAISFVETIRARGVPLDALFHDLLAPAARHLGELWKQDLCDFTAVTVGLCQLHQLLRSLSRDHRSEADPGSWEGLGIDQRGSGPRVLLAPAPGEQHTFGLLMVVQCFHRAGWQVWDHFPASGDELVDLVRGERFDVIGLSASCDRWLDALAPTIQSIRRASRNQAIRVMVGGQLFTERPELVTYVGADGTASDGRQVVIQANDLLALPADGCR